METTELDPQIKEIATASDIRNNLLRALSSTFRALIWQGNKQSTGFMERIGLTLPQAAIMWTLGASGGRVTMSDLAQLTHQSAATVTGIVDRLTDATLVERERDLGDRRVVYVCITRQGMSKLSEMEAERLKQIERLAQGLTNEELDQLNSILSRLILTLE